MFIYCIINIKKKNRNRGGSYIDFPDWMKNKTVTITLHHEEIGKYSERITEINPYINKYNWKERNFSSRNDD